MGKTNIGRKMMMGLVAASMIVPALAVPGTASAQSAREAHRSDQRVRDEQRDLRQARRYGDRQDVRRAQRDVKVAKREAREDWRDYRRAHRDTYRRPAYQGPRGYRYRPVAVGHRFERSYYGDRYWVRDYRRYRLPAPHAGQRWVRYNNDVVLISMRSGRVLRVYNGFFW